MTIKTMHDGEGTRKTILATYRLGEPRRDLLPVWMISFARDGMLGRRCQVANGWLRDWGLSRRGGRWDSKRRATLGALACGRIPMATGQPGEEDSRAISCPCAESAQEGFESGWSEPSQLVKIQRLDQANQDRTAAITHPS